jgi:hypothetical protein
MSCSVLSVSAFALVLWSVRFHLPSLTHIEIAPVGA